ncbi:NAD(P)-binding oxidoreductase [Pseudoalteromonas sp. OOF1S-7]|uniref:NAD(P)-dependent oxidoreductase n=1 Tax=Pseudoalteromonas sp. OOF1S-7 TaxID=2917757 RepID=UPI001EF5C2C1|nr:NAD(P)-binding oxidoreductase [Pseudoalteromonas sp. OOF1S-7]MCG7536910.1 SDR family oxidoreductase [Pseudoalteromonas sp. OOF1S-7]
MILVIGASGATGKLVVEQLLLAQELVRVLVRPSSVHLQEFKASQQLDVSVGTISELSSAELDALLSGVKAVICCLGHRATFQGIYGHPRRLVSDAVNSVCQAIDRSNAHVKFILMNSTGCRNEALNECPSLAHRAVVALLRLCLPPHPDNEAAARSLRVYSPAITGVDWVVVRPDSLVDEAKVTAYDVHPSPIRDAIFDAGKTSRINVAHFMCQLALDPQLWQHWQGQSPVIYNQSQR